MNAKKIKTALLAIFLLAGSFFIAYADNKNTRYIIKTQYFDVIYKTPSRNTALLISENIDRLYQDLKASLKTEDYYDFNHFPVYIEYTTEEMNAFFTDYPFRHITIYDTVPDHDLALFDNNILSVLQHELAHAVTLNVKNKFNQTVSNVFYNGLGFSFYTEPKFLTEGIAVQKESEGGQGRLNDPYALHVIRQAVIDEKIPTIQELTGARDIYPSGNIPYIFGGAFNQWMISIYGKDKFKEFTVSLNNQLRNYTTIYKNTFGKEIKDDYDLFINSIKIPAVTKNPYETEGISDYYQIFDETKKIQKKNSRVISTASFITDSNSGTAWYRSDSNEIWYASQNRVNDEKEIIPPHKLFTMTGVEKISFSSDGRYLALSRILSYDTRTNAVSVYDMKEKKFVNFSQDYRDAAVLSHDGKYYLAAVKTMSQDCTIEILQITDNSKFIPIKTVSLDSGNIPFDLSDAGNNTLAFIFAHGVKRAISLYNIELDVVNSVPVPEGMFIRDLSVIAAKSFVTGQKGILLGFSYAEKERIPAMGFLSIKIDSGNFSSVKFHLQKNEISGGVYSPAVYFSSGSLRLPSIVYVSKFFDESRLSLMDTDCFEFEQTEAFVKSETQYPVRKKTEPSNEEVKIKPEKFSPFDYTFRGIFVPLSLIPLYDENFQIQSMGIAGITWHSKGYHISAGFDPLTMSYGFTTSIFNESQSGNADFHISAHCAFDESGFRQTEDEIIMSSKIPVFNYSNITLSSTTKFFYGHPDKLYLNDSLFKKQPDNAVFATLVNQEAIDFSTVHKTGPGPFEAGGINAGLLFNYTLIDSDIERLNGRGINIGIEAGFRLPNILPFENPQNITCNLPLICQINLFPAVNRFLTFDATVILFNIEVQKGTYNFFLPLYLNRFYVTAKYSSSLYYSRPLNMAIFNPESLKNSLNGAFYSDSVGIGFVMALTVNTGYFVQIGTLNVSADLIYDLNQYNPENNRIHLKLCSQLVF